MRVDAPLCHLVLTNELISIQGLGKLMSDWSRRIPFKVDIAGIIEIMGASLYSRIDTPIRELIQNAHDAVTRRRHSDLQFQGRIDVRQDAEHGTLSFSDDGVGLTPKEAEEYLGTLGVGMTGLIKRGVSPEAPSPRSTGGNDLIGMFGIGLFSGFMLADEIVVVSRHTGHDQAVRWEAGAGTDILLSAEERETSGTTVTLKLKPELQSFASDPELLESVIREYADFLTVPIYINDGKQRANTMTASWFEATTDQEALELELASTFNESPLDVIPCRMEKPVSIAGALYISPQRVPGFADASTVMVTVRRMVISRNIRELLPPWATFLRGVLELNDCAPTASREDLVRDNRFELVRSCLHDQLFSHLESLVESDRQRLDATIAWHRYTFAGAALEDRRLRDLLRRVYTIPTSKGLLTINEVLERSDADPLFETEADRVVWYNSDRRQERWINQVFDGHDVPCVHAFRSFEETLLAQIIADDNEAGGATDLRIVSPGSQNFAEGVLGLTDMEDVDETWQQFLDSTGARVMLASFQSRQPVMAFLNERYELFRAFDDIRKEGSIPAGFQRLIDNQLQRADGERSAKNEIVLNRNHPMVSRVLSQRTGKSLSSVLRLLVMGALNSAGASVETSARQQQMDDLDWIAEALWGRDS